MFPALLPLYTRAVLKVLFVCFFYAFCLFLYSSSSWWVQCWGELLPLTFCFIRRVHTIVGCSFTWRASFQYSIFIHSFKLVYTICGYFCLQSCKRLWPFLRRSESVCVCLSVFPPPAMSQKPVKQLLSHLTWWLPQLRECINCSLYCLHSWSHRS